ncbi:Kinesin protein [Fasciola gigantica]|uniref:Kinesin protein n=1 Tax=Fasciola gigantica TaxID=46835 RepID=A0A504Z1V4_FASGI|nr:Kinesin protein [Fasciola gigantica]
MAVDGSSQESDATCVNVAVRIRPQSSKEKLSMNQICTSVAQSAPQIILGKDSSFMFDYVFNTNSTQDQIFQALAKPLIDGCMNGYNATILAYGQTGSGKTYTMGTGFELGIGHTDAGIIPRAVQYLFASVANHRAQAAARHEPVPEFKVVAQFLELYNEELVDLLDGDRARKPHLRLHENAQGDIYLTGVSTRLVSSLDDTLKCLRDGSLVRSTASTNMNAQSSRSHAIFTLHIRQQRLVKYDEEPNGTKTEEHSQGNQDSDASGADQVPEFETLTAKFHFVDLAGSERLKRTGATGDRAKEGISINRGLLALGNVISALGDKAKRGCHVPYRDSKLTRLLQDSLGGNSRTIMIACISPSDCDFVETLNTLKYANRARNIRNRVIMNQDKTSKQLATLRAQLVALQEELDEYKQGKRIAASEGADGATDLAHELEFWRMENDKLRLRVKALTVTIDSLKVRNAQLLADQEASSWALSKTRLLQAAQSGISNSTADPTQLLTMASNESSPLHLIVEEMDSFRQLVEKYTVENEELRTKLIEAEALAEFGQRNFTHASPGNPNRLSEGTYGSRGTHRVALTNNEFPDLDSSTIAAAEAGLSAMDFYMDEETTSSKAKLHHKKHRRHHRKHGKQKEPAGTPERKPLKDVSDNHTIYGKNLGDVGDNAEPDEGSDLVTLVLNGDTYTDLDEDGASEKNDDGVFDQVTNTTCVVSVENNPSEDMNGTLLGDHPADETLTHSDHHPSRQHSSSHDQTLFDASDVELSESNESEDASGSEDDNDEDDEENDEYADTNEADNVEESDHARNVREAEAKLHRSLASVSSAIDSKQRLLAELQSKAAQLDQLRKHYERQLEHLQSRIRETERERDSVLANLGHLEHTGEERLRRTREEFAKKLSCLQDEVKNLQMSRQEQVRLEREQAKKNNELRQLRSELEELRRYKVDLTKRLQQETKRSRQIEAMSAKRLLEMKKAKTQADNQLRSLAAAHTAKERALKQKQAELDALKRKTLEQQRQLSMAASRMTRSVYGGSISSGSSVTPKTPTRNIMSASMYGSMGSTNMRIESSRIVNSAKAKWTIVLRQLETEVQRRQTSARLEHDLQTWIRERESLGRRLLRLQRRRARVEESAADDTEPEDVTPKLAEFDEQIRNVTAQLESVQEAIRECQASIIELDKSGPKLPNVLPTRGRVNSSRSMSNPTLAVFTNCSLTESRFLLGQLYEDAVSRALLVSRLQQSEAQLRANLSVWEQEREQEIEVLRLAMQHAGLPTESVDNVLSVTNSGDRNTRPTSATPCPQHGLASQSGCECCSITNGMVSAPLSSDDSSGPEDSRADDPSVERSLGRYYGGHVMSHSMYATLEPIATTRCIRRHLSEADDSSLDRLYERASETASRLSKARGRMLQPQDMLGLTTPAAFGQSTDPGTTDLMPPPSGSFFLRRPRTALGYRGPTVNGSVVPSAPRETNGPLSAGPSPAIRRRVVPSQSASNQQSVIYTPRPNLPAVHSIPGAMSTSLTFPDTNGPSNETNAINGPNTTINATDVFNRLTVGMSSSPSPGRGSIQSLNRNAIIFSPPLTDTTAPNVLCGSTQSYRLNASAVATTAAGAFTTAVGTPSTDTNNQPLAAFFSNNNMSSAASGLPQSTSNSTTTSATTGSTSCPVVPVMSGQPVPSFRVPMECTHVARGHSNAVLDVDIVGNLMLTGSKDRTAKVWDLETMEEVDTFRDHPNNVSKVRMCPVSGLIFTVCSYFIKVWDRRESRKCIRTLLSSGLYQDGELETKITRRQNICPPGETNIMDIVLGGSHPSLSHSMFLATANSVKLWDLRRYYAVGKLHGSHQAPVMVMAADKNPTTTEPQLTVVTGSKDHYIKVFNVGADASGLLTPTFDLEPPHYDGIESLALHGNILFSGSRDAAIKKWNLARDGRQEVMLAQAHKDWVQGLAVTGDGKTLISGCRGGHLKVWNVEDCMCLGEMPNAHDGAVNAVRTCGDRVFTAGSDKDVRFWRLLDHSHS